jgi:hypothetical protein
MARLQLRRGVIGIREGVELVHVVDDHSAVASRLQRGVNLAKARDGSLPLGCKKWKVRGGILNNIVPTDDIISKQDCGRKE